MPQGVWDAIRGGLRTVVQAIRARPALFVGIALTVLLLDLLLPLTILSIVRKPWDYFAFNRWRREMLWLVTSPKISPGRKMDFLFNVPLCWFGARRPPLASNWIFFVAVQDFARWWVIAALFGAYFTLLAHKRARFARPQRWWLGVGRYRWVTGVLLVTLELFTSPCTVRGYETSPGLPVIGLALKGLTGSALVFLTVLSEAVSLAAVVAVSLLVLIIGSKPWAGNSGVAKRFH